MERAERFIVLGFGLLFSELLIAVLWVMFVLTLVTAVQRFVKVWRQASGMRPVPRRVRLTQRRAARAGRARRRLGGDESRRGAWRTRMPPRDR
jgi:CDP-diacylglycerol--glycerol-3-phosphate 3-phosphatidyltransferase